MVGCVVQCSHSNGRTAGGVSGSKTWPAPVAACCRSPRVHSGASNSDAQQGKAAHVKGLAQPGWPSNDLHARSVGGFRSPYQYPIATKELVPGVKRDLSNQFRPAVARTHAPIPNGGLLIL